MLIENEVGDHGTTLIVLLLLLVEINTVAQVASLGLGCARHTLLRENDLGLILFRIDVLDALLLVLATSLDKASAVPRFTQICAQTQSPISHIGRRSTLVLHRIGSEQIFLTTGLSLSRESSLELLFVNAHVQDIRWLLLLLLLSWRIRLSTHGRRLLIGESSSRSLL